MRRALLPIVLLLLLAARVSAQDPSFTQAYFNPVYLNPALVGTNEGMRFTMNYRNQWTYIPGMFETVHASFDAYEPKMNSGIGLTFMHDAEGEGKLATTSVGLFYQYGMRTRNDWYFGLGLGAKLANSSIEWNKLEFSDQFHPVLGNVYQSGAQRPGTSTTSYVDMADFGVLIKKKYFSRKNRQDNLFSLGASVHHFFKADNEFFASGTIPPQYTVHSGLMLGFSQRSLFKGGYAFPHAVVRMQNNLLETLFGVYGFREPFLLGLSYHNGELPFTSKNTNSFCALAGFQHPHKNSDLSYQIAYSYDFNISGLSVSTLGSHELSLILFFDGKSLLGNMGRDFESSCLKVRKKGSMPPF